MPLHNVAGVFPYVSSTGCFVIPVSTALKEHSLFIIRSLVFHLDIVPQQPGGVASKLFAHPADRDGYVAIGGLKSREGRQNCRGDNSTQESIGNGIKVQGKMA